jgi:hypothetical protein
VFWLGMGLSGPVTHSKALEVRGPTASQRQATGPWRTRIVPKAPASIGPNGRAAEAVTRWPAAHGRHGRARQAEPILAQRAPGRHTAPDAAVAIEGARRRSARMSLLGNRAVPVILGLLRIMAQRCKTEPRPRRGRREDRSPADGRFAQQR